MGMPEPLARVPAIAVLFLAPEERIGGIAVGGSGEAMLFHPGDFSLEQIYALSQLVLRIGGEIFARELARGIASWSGTIVVFHRLGIVLPRQLAVNNAAR
jgi:hypothetical protein